MFLTLLQVLVIRNAVHQEELPGLVLKLLGPLEHILAAGDQG